MPELQVSARYEIDQPMEEERVSVGFGQASLKTPVRWIWRVAWMPRGQYEEMRLDLSKEECQDLVADALDRVYLDLDRAHESSVTSGSNYSLHGWSPGGPGKDAEWLLRGWPTPLKFESVGSDDESMMFAQRAFSLN